MLTFTNPVQLVPGENNAGNSMTTTYAFPLVAGPYVTHDSLTTSILWAAAMADFKTLLTLVNRARAHEKKMLVNKYFAKQILI